MKIPNYALALATSVALTTISFGGSTAKQAIATLKTAEGTKTSENIFTITGRFGQDQPQEWEILAAEGDGVWMFIVDSKSIRSKTKVRTRNNVKLPTASLKIDSKKAFLIAEKAAKKASVGFDSLNYSLKRRTDKPATVWIVSLADFKGLTVGEVHVAADSGTILRTNWNKEQLNRPVVASRAPSTGATRGIIADRRNSSVKTSSTADGVREGLSSLRDVFRREPVNAPNQKRGPATTRTAPR